MTFRESLFEVEYRNSDIRTTVNDFGSGVTEVAMIILKQKYLSNQALERVIAVGGNRETKQFLSNLTIAFTEFVSKVVGALYP